MFLIFDTEKKADTVNDRIGKSMGLPKGKTLKYGNVIKHQGKSKWALVINNGADEYLTGTEKGNITDLDSDWYPEAE